MEYKGYKIESIRNDGHLQRVAFGIYKNGKLISTAETSKEAQHEVDNIMYHPVTIEYIIVNKKNDSKSRETIKTTESDVDKKIKELERKYSNDKTYYLRDIRKVYDMKAIDKLDNAIKALDSDFYQLKFYPSEKVEGTKQFSEKELDEYAKALLKKYGDKRVVITQMGKVYKTFYA